MARLTDKQIKDLNYMNRAAQNVELGKLLDELVAGAEQGGEESMSKDQITNLVKTMATDGSLDDVRLKDSDYGLKQLHDILNYDNGVIYVRKGNSGQTENGKWLTPYSTISLAKQALLPNRTQIEIADSSAYAEANIAWESPATKVCGKLADFTGNTTINSQDMSLYLSKHTGNITLNKRCAIYLDALVGDLTINADKCVVFIKSMKGDIEIAGDNTVYIFVDAFDNSTCQIISKDAQRFLDGSKIGAYTYGYIAM